MNVVRALNYFRWCSMDLITQLNCFMANTGLDYAICGGHAIDLFLGKKTRQHKDLDAIIYWEDRDRIVQHMLDEGWEIYEPCGTPYMHKINNISDQMRVKSNIWCIKPTNQHYKCTEHEKDMFAVDFDNSEQTDLDYIEFLFNTKTDEHFLYSRNHDVKLELNRAVLHIGNFPCLAPEMVLLYKSTAADEPEYQLDFDNTIVKLNNEQLSWLKESLVFMFPDGHKWLNNL